MITIIEEKQHVVLNLHLYDFREAGLHQAAGESGGVGRRHSGVLLRGARRSYSNGPLAEGGGRPAPRKVQNTKTPPPQLYCLLVGTKSLFLY